MNGAGVVQPLAPEPAPVATVTEPDVMNEQHLNAVIELLETTLSITDNQEIEEQIQLQLELLYINKEII